MPKQTDRQTQHSHRQVVEEREPRQTSWNISNTETLCVRQSHMT